MWKQITGFDYEVSNCGELRHISLKNVLTPSSDKDGYKQIGIRKREIERNTGLEYIV